MKPKQLTVTVLVLIVAMLTTVTAMASVSEVPKLSNFRPGVYMEDIWVNRGFSAGFPWANQTLLVSAAASEDWAGFRVDEDDDSAWGFVTVTLENDFSAYEEVLFEIATRDTALCADWAKIYWDDVLLFEWVPKTEGDQLVVHEVRINVQESGLHLTAGEHEIKLVAGKSGGAFDFAHLNSLRISAL